MSTKSTENQPKSKQPSSDNGKALTPADYEKLRGIVTGLNPADNAHWNQAGGPDMNYIKEAMGMVITADNIKFSGVGGWTRETSQKMADEKADREAAGKTPAEKDNRTTVAGADPKASKQKSPEEGHTPAGSDPEEAPETPLEREERQRREARAMQAENDTERASKHDESAAKIRAQIAAQNKADKKLRKDDAAQKKQQGVDDAAAAIARHERVAVEPSIHGIFDPEKEPGSDDIHPMIRIDQLERAVLTLSKVLLDTTMTPVQRGKLANCVTVLVPPTDEDIISDEG